ncbi:MAG: peptidoglycan DD-metalloendopeptidase family protein [Deltaproteobacteria bacterium]|nr:peptidoglycan DD-metalloendopeptidase family protein [Deltaproteobacteria bacterium]
MMPSHFFRVPITAQGFAIPVFLLLWVCAFPSPEYGHAEKAPGPDTKKDQIRKLETDLSREKEKYLKFGEKEKSLLDQLSDIEKKTAEQRHLLKQIRRKIGISKKELKQLQNRQANLEGRLKKVEGRLERRLVAFYKYAKRGYVQLLATSMGMDQLRKRVKYLTVVMGEDQRLFKEMMGMKNGLNQEISRIQDKLETIDGLEKAEKERLASIKKELDKRVILLVKIHKEKEFYETAVHELELAAANLKDTLLQLEKKQLPKKLPSGLSKAKGKLPLPCRGKIIRNTSPLGRGKQGSSRGIYIEGPSGAKVKAIFPGRVDYSGWLKGYGQIVIINHGSRFFSISGHLMERNKTEGDMVAKGTVIGLLGQSESLAGPRLYFELRRGGSTLDPFKWLKVR